MEQLKDRNVCCLETFTLTDDIPVQHCYHGGMSFYVGTQVSIYYSRGGWRGLLHGIDENGNAWEGIEIGPFRSRLTCIRALLNHYDEHEMEDE